MRLQLFSYSNGTSMISLIIPPKDQIARISKMLADEFGTASNIKSRVNRLSVLGAITSVQHRLKLYAKGIGSLSGRYILTIMRRLTTLWLLQFPLMVWSFTVEQLLLKRARKKKLTLILNHLNPSTLPCICVTTK